jgi:hypothetical protein
MAGKLKPLDVQRERKSGKYADCDGLYLIVVSPTSKNWSYRYWFKGKQRWLGLGSFKDVSLKEARLARDAARLQVDRRIMRCGSTRHRSYGDRRSPSATGEAGRCATPASSTTGLFQSCGEMR